ncbi:hypothetical protein [Tunicatimonas pelagia]|uniref:hypothetical protein n=1 Tax=Tunicatimonas pelagia TaxID=931531 RepID=UPI002666AA8C|nr:hypothetical protein [Tunicatimonas pelagia]WKN44639.1 hypothetical protein P0M28_06635 [Tunicatimonas pelagia]
MAAHPAWVKKILLVLGIAGTAAILLTLSFRLWVQSLIGQAVRLGCKQRLPPEPSSLRAIEYEAGQLVRS